jgi:hypothetical protein
VSELRVLGRRLGCDWCGRYVSIVQECPQWEPVVRFVCVKCYQELDRLDALASRAGVRRWGEPRSPRGGVR